MTRDERMLAVQRAYNTAMAERASWDDFVADLDRDGLPGLSDLLDGKAVIMPVNLTENMREAGQAGATEVFSRNIATTKTVNDSVYAAMLAANPYRSKTDADI